MNHLLQRPAASRLAVERTMKCRVRVADPLVNLDNLSALLTAVVVARHGYNPGARVGNWLKPVGTEHPDGNIFSSMPEFRRIHDAPIYITAAVPTQSPSP